MTAPNTLYMTQIRIKPEALMAFARDHDHHKPHDDDLGYTAHAWLAAMFGQLAPAPFRIFPPKGRSAAHPSWKILAYTTSPMDTLMEHASMYATPTTMAVTEAGYIAQKTMPGIIPKGKEVAFESMVCPVTRVGAAEKDVYLRRVETSGEGPPPSRLEAYLQWLHGRLEGAATMKNVSLQSFRLARMTRKNHPGGDEPRAAKSLVFPQAVLSGQLRVENEAAFMRLLARGLGRHRAFGYGMILLRPPR